MRKRPNFSKERGKSTESCLTDSAWTGRDSHLIDSMMQQFGSINPGTDFSLRFS